MNRNARRALSGMLTVGALGAATAFAATPEGGKVDSTTPRVDWKGEVTASWFPSRAVILANLGGQSGHVPCRAPTCDTFALEVGEKKDLTIGVTSPAPEDQVIVRIKTPAGEFVTTVGDTDSKAQMTVKFKNAAVGPYTIDYWNYYTNATTEYSGWAQLAGVAPAPAPGGPSTEPTQPPQDPGQQPQQTNPNPQPQPQPQPGTGSTEAIALSVKVGKASAKKLKKARKLKATVTVSRPATVSGTLKKGKKTIAKGRAAVQKSGTLTLKIAKKAARKLKKGKYSLVVAATDGKTTTSKTVRVTVRK